MTFHCSALISFHTMLTSSVWKNSQCMKLLFQCLQVVLVFDWLIGTTQPQQHCTEIMEHSSSEQLVTASPEPFDGDYDTRVEMVVCVALVS